MGPLVLPVTTVIQAGATYCVTVSGQLRTCGHVDSLGLPGPFILVLSTCPEAAKCPFEMIMLCPCDGC